MRCIQLNNRARAALLGSALALGAGCSLLAPPDSETVGNRPSAAAGASPNSLAGGGGTDTGDSGAAGADDPNTGLVDVGTPTGAWATVSGSLVTSWGANVRTDDVHRDYPRPLLVRHAWATLNGLWDYALRSKVDPQPASWDGKILVPFAIESPLSGIGKQLPASGQLWYRRDFEMPSDWREQRLLLHFGAVDYSAQLFVNGMHVGDHVGGYDSFTFDVTDQLVSGSTQEVVLAVTDPTDSGSQPRGKQNDSPTLGSLTQVSGIWQSVWLEPVPTSYLDSLDVVSSAHDGTVTVEARLGGATRDDLRLSVSVLDGNAVVAQGDGPAGSALTVKVPKPKLWSPAAPNLYDLSFELKSSTSTIDSAQSYVGLRDVSLQLDEAGVRRVFVNDDPLFQLGVIDQGYWPDGLYTPPSDEAMKTDIVRAKQLGFVAMRKHQKVESDRFYYWCDKLGLLVWQDMPAATVTTTAAQAEFSNELTALVTQHWNHPSIAAWNLFYFGVGQLNTTDLAASVKALDPTRLVVSVTGWTDDGTGDIHDRPDFARPSSVTPDTRAAGLGAFGSLSQGVDGHVWHETTAFNYDPKQAVPALSDEYQTLLSSAWGLNASPGLSMAMYRQLNDVEGELDGLFTYDRAILKVDSARVQKSNAGELDKLYTVLETSDVRGDPEYTPSGGVANYFNQGHLYRYTFDDPGAGWEKPGFDDSSWAKSQAPFGRGVIAGASYRSTWLGTDIWIRGDFSFAGPAGGSTFLRVFHQNEVYAYVNGAFAASAAGSNSDYQDLLISSAAQASITSGTGLIAAHCRQTVGTQFLDVGLVLSPTAAPLLAAVEPSNPVASANFAKYSGTWDVLPDFTTLSPTDVGKVPALTLAAAGTSTVNFGLEFTGYLKLPRNGIYTFFLNSDDASRLRIDDTVVVDNDTHSQFELSGSVPLEAGFHAFRLSYYQKSATQLLQVSWAGPGLTKQAVPSTAIFRDLLPATAAPDAAPSVAWAQYNGSFSRLPDFTKLTPVATGLAPAPSVSVTKSTTLFALQFRGYIDIPSDGYYSFASTSDDGQVLSIDGRVIVNNDRLKPNTENTGNVCLAAGKHPFNLDYRQGSGSQGSLLSWTGQTFAKQLIPASAFFH